MNQPIMTEELGCGVSPHLISWAAGTRLWNLSELMRGFSVFSPCEYGGVGCPHIYNTAVPPECDSQITRGCGVSPHLIRGHGVSPQITGLTLDSREATSGTLFCALQGTSQHGLEFATQAVERGAVAIVAETSATWPISRCDELSRSLKIPLLIMPDLGQQLGNIAGKFYGHPGQSLDIIGVTGTNGKTSVCHILAQALHPEPGARVIGTIGYGIPGRLENSSHTTPNAIKLQAILAQFRHQGVKVVAMEISSHALEQGRAVGLPINTAIFTNLTRDHLDYHKNLGAYAKAKRRLFYTPGLKHAVINADDPLGLEILADLAPTVQPVLYSLNPSFTPSRIHRTANWLRLEFLEHQNRGMRLWFTSSWGCGDITLPMLGRFNAANLLAAMATMLLRDPNLAAVLSRLAKARGVPGRMECFGHYPQPLVVIDYAHTPDALEQVLKELRSHQPQRLITIFGCGGERDRGKRPQMGAAAEAMSDVVILTDDNPRGEDGGHIMQDILAGVKAPNAIQIERHRGTAIRNAIAGASAKDIVLIAGKGHETTQIIGKIVYPFDDRIEATEALRDHLGVRGVPTSPVTCGGHPHIPH